MTNFYLPEDEANQYSSDFEALSAPRGPDLALPPPSRPAPAPAMAPMSLYTPAPPAAPSPFDLEAQDVMGAARGGQPSFGSRIRDAFSAGQPSGLFEQLVPIAPAARFATGLRDAVFPNQYEAPPLSTLKLRGHEIPIYATDVAGSVDGPGAADDAAAAINRVRTHIPDDLGPIADQTPWEALTGKLQDFLKRERRITQTGTHQAEIEAGRAVQGANIGQAMADLPANATTAEVEAATRAAARVGPLRQTFADALDVTPEESVAFAQKTAELTRTGELSDFEYMRANILFNRLIEEGGQRLQPQERALLSRVLGEDVVDALERRPQTVNAAYRAEQADIAKMRIEDDRLLARTQEQALKAQQAADAAAVDARLKQLGEAPVVRARGPISAEAEAAQAQQVAGDTNTRVLTARRRAIDASNKADAALIDAGRARQAKLEMAAEQRTVRDASGRVLKRSPGMTARERELQGLPNPDMMMERARAIGAELKVPEVEGIVDNWLRSSAVLLENAGASNAMRTARSIVTGDLADPWLNQLYHSREGLTNALETAGITREASSAMVEQIMMSRLAKRYGLERVLNDKGRLIQQLPEEARALIAPAGGVHASESFKGVELFVARVKNLQFGPLDVGIFQQLKAGLDRGGVAYFAGLVNRAASALGHPLLPEVLADGISRTAQYAIDGVAQGARTGGVERLSEAGTPFRYAMLGGNTRVGRTIDDVLTRWSDRSTELQFGVALQHMRNTSYEGNLLIEHLLGRNIADPRVRAAAARSANATTSFSFKALSSKRASGERILAISPSMLRARFSYVEQMAKIIAPPQRLSKTLSATPEERIMAAQMIISTVLSAAVVTKVVDSLWGTGDSEVDPSKPGHGIVTLRAKDSNGRNIVLDMQPGDTVTNAFARSVRLLAEGNPAEIAKIWAKVGLGSGSIVTQAAAAVTGSGFQTGHGYRFGDLPLRNRLLNITPLPPAIQQLLDRQPAVYEAGQVGGLNMFPESGYARAQRETGDEFQGMTTAQRAEFLKDKPDLQEQLRQDALSGGTDRAAVRQKVDDQKMSELRGAADRFAGRTGKPVDGAGFRDLVNGIQQTARDTLDGAAMARGDQPGTDPESKYYSFADQAKDVSGNIDYELLGKLQADYLNTLDPQVAQDIRDRTAYRSNPMLPEEVRQLFDTRDALDRSGFFDIGDGVWKALQAQGIAGTEGYGSYQEWRVGKQKTIAAGLVKNLGLPTGQADDTAKDMMGSDPITKIYSEQVKGPRSKWAYDHPQLADEATTFAFFNSDKPTRELIIALLAKKP